MKPALLLAALWIATTAAVRVPHDFTLPSNAVTRSTEAIIRRADGVEFAVAMYAESTGTALAVPGAPGSRMRFWTLQSQDWRSGSGILWVRCCNTAGCGDWSNRAITLAGVPDTLWTITRGPGAKPLPENPWKLSRFGRVGWRLAPGDSAAAAIRHQEDLQRVHSVKLVQIYGKWMLRGAAQTVPDHDPPRIDP